MSNATRRIGLGTVLALLVGTLAIGFAIKAPCASGNWTDGRQYARLCYSDNVHQLESEQLTSNRLPFLDACRTGRRPTCRSRRPQQGIHRSRSSPPSRCGSVT